MKKFVNLLNFEMNRLLNFLLPTLGAFIVLQLLATVQTTMSYNKEARKIMAAGPGDAESVLQNMGTFSMQQVTGSSLFNLSLLLIVLIFGFYAFFTWYREWLGKNTFVYRLLMLPVNRFYIILSKSLVFLIGGLLTFVTQFGMLFVESLLAKQIIMEPEFYQNLSVHSMKPIYNFFFHVLFPLEFIEFVSVYSFAFAALISLFTAILFERSFGIKGGFFGVIYFIGYFVIYSFLSSIPYTGFITTVLKPSQIYIGILVYQFFVVGLGYLISRFLLTHKIKV